MRSNSVVPVLENPTKKCGGGEGSRQDFLLRSLRFAQCSCTIRSRLEPVEAKVCGQVFAIPGVRFRELQLWTMLRTRLHGHGFDQPELPARAKPAALAAGSLKWSGFGSYFLASSSWLSSLRTVLLRTMANSSPPLADFSKSPKASLSRRRILRASPRMRWMVARLVPFAANARVAAFCFFFAAKLQQESCGPGQRRAILGPLIDRLQDRSCGGRLAALQMYFGHAQQRGSKTGALRHGCLESRKRSLFFTRGGQLMSFFNQCSCTLGWCFSARVWSGFVRRLRHLVRFKIR